ncbi:acetyl-CoA carboxylase family protein [Ketobacter sp.]|uniref:acetyl-CoA carboxylase family protein n=1 Tax=Ketobacter sp. TaxID=2083498 RepID=UPI000F14B3F6|nr:carboxyl transferase domain-containing protein [Ketobacter sp.]RLT93807.1 MAG: ATP-grasp domain-containing protein [Ketobacter sp.]
MNVQPIEKPHDSVTPPFTRLLIANRGEIAVRIARSAADLGLETVAVFSEDDRHSGHLGAADRACPLQGQGVAAYLDGQQILAIAQQQGCDAIHPGYGFLSENSAFAAQCAAAGVVFVGPSAEHLALFGDKLQARALAQQCGIAVNAGTDGVTSLQQAQAFFARLPPGAAMMIKAVAGGGGKGMRIVRHAHELEAAFARCTAEALRAFGNGDLYVERLIQRARHIEVQIIADGEEVSHLWERECTLQRQQQKLVEYAPSMSLTPQQRQWVLEAATRMARASGYRNLGTFEFLLDLERPPTEEAILFLEANPRLQVEHTVTEAVLGLDLVQIQLELAAGRRLAELSMSQSRIPLPRGYAAQLRINLETLDPQGRPLPTIGTIQAFTAPLGPGVRVDSFATPGYDTVPGYDSLLAKLIVHSPRPDFATLLHKLARAAAELRIDGVTTNLPFLQRLLAHPAVISNQIHTRFIEDHLHELQPEVTDTSGASGRDGAGAVIQAPLQGVVVELAVAVGDRVQADTELLLIEAMKLQHELRAGDSGVVASILVKPGDSVNPGDALLILSPCDVADAIEPGAKPGHSDTGLREYIREDLQQVRDRVQATLDPARPQAVARRHQRGQRTARENLDHLCDADSFIEYGQLAVAYLHARHSDAELRDKTPADGFVMGLATVNAALFGDTQAQVAVGSYDATVMAGTQGHKNHQKTDRLFDLAREHRIPLILFAEGGGGRPREDPVTIAALENQNFYKLAELSGTVPVIGIVSGRCFAGNAVLLGMADVIIATDNSNIGMAGPALIEAGGLGTFTPEQVGPIQVQHRNGVVDIRVRDEAEAVTVAKQYLSYFQGPLATWQAHDPQQLRHLIPENRVRAYDVRRIIHALADQDSVLELRAAFGAAYVTALMRVEGRPVGVIANNPMFNAGAIDAEGADKAARFMRLCDAHGLPILTLIDTPGIMVGPEAEHTALVRHSSRLFLTAASVQVPLFAIVLRKAYGLGAMAAAGGHFKRPFFTIAWPSGELGGMGLEGGVRLAYKKELEAITDPEARQAFFEERVASRYRKGKASYLASYFELDAVIDPADSRQWLVRGLDATAPCRKNSGRFIDAW